MNDYTVKDLIENEMVSVRLKNILIANFGGRQSYLPINQIFLFDFMKKRRAGIVSWMELCKYKENDGLWMPVRQSNSTRIEIQSDKDGVIGYCSISGIVTNEMAESIYKYLNAMAEYQKTTMQ